MSHFKAGDLALVWKCATFPEIVGKCVELISFVPAGQSYPNWEPMEVDAWMVSGEGLFCKQAGLIKSIDKTLLAERLLMPLRGQFTPETERETELTQ